MYSGRLNRNGAGVSTDSRQVAVDASRHQYNANRPATRASLTLTQIARCIRFRSSLMRMSRTSSGLMSDYTHSDSGSGSGTADDDRPIICEFNTEKMNTSCRSQTIEIRYILQYFATPSTELYRDHGDAEQLRPASIPSKQAQPVVGRSTHRPLE